MNKIGTIKEIAGLKWRILDKTEQGYLAITEGSIGDKVIDKDLNDWRKSSLREYLNNDFRKELENSGVELIEFERDLMSVDGQTEYETCKDFVSILTEHEYQRYRKHLPNKNDWWWLITPWSTPCNGCEYLNSVVSPSGIINDGFCNNYLGVRPVCILKSTIFVS